MVFFLLSLVGIPPFVGFLGQLPRVRRRHRAGLALVRGAINAVIAARHSLRVIEVMAVDAGERHREALKRNE
jgi:NADH:ubiquinone oxidoreductase subunit 2 (subunit N)